jgi:hypothetical protein
MPSIFDTSSGKGELKKMKIYAYTDIDLADDHLASIPGVTNPFTVLINPETYNTEYKVEFNADQSHGSTQGTAKFTRKPPDEISFEFLFDNTGIIDGRSRESITDDINHFHELLVGYDGNNHEPRHFKLCWGTLLFKGRCTLLSINYKLFNPDGTPIRAVCKTSFKGSIEEDLRVALENNKSPDLTHYRVVHRGDTLPLMCHKIYGNSSMYLQVAQVNKLQNFRNLEVGSELFFPPIDKIKATV